MTLQSFDSELNPTLVKRGKVFFREGQIIEMVQKGNGIWKAFAPGAKKFSVLILLNEDQILEKICTCSFIGPACKHEVGILFAIRSEITGEVPKPKKLTKKLTVEGKLELIRQKVSLPVLVDF